MKPKQQPPKTIKTTDAPKPPPLVIYGTDGKIKTVTGKKP